MDQAALRAMIREEIHGEVGPLQTKVGDMLKILNGNGKLGLVGRVEILWRSYVAILCWLSASAGSLVTYLVMSA